MSFYTIVIYIAITSFLLLLGIAFLVGLYFIFRPFYLQFFYKVKINQIKEVLRQYNHDEAIEKIILLGITDAELVNLAQKQLRKEMKKNEKIRNTANKRRDEEETSYPGRSETPGKSGNETRNEGNTADNGRGNIKQSDNAPSGPGLFRYNPTPKARPVNKYFK